MTPLTTLEQSFKITPEQLQQAITPATKWLVLNSPHNPTGAVYSAEELKTLGEILEKHPHVWVLSDEIYKDLSLKLPPSIGAVCPFLKERLVIIHGVSKSYAMTGWRIGFAAAPKHFIDALTAIQSQQTSGACSIAQYAALSALKGPKHWQEEQKQLIEENRQYMWQFLKEQKLPY